MDKPTLENIYISASRVYIKGIDASLNDRSFGINNNLVYLICENCKGGHNSFGDISAGTFTNCVAGDNSFGFYEATGTYTNCVAGDNSFGQISAGTYTNCVAGVKSFGVNITSGIFTNCVADDGSFSSKKNGATGRLYFCRLNNGAFSAVSSGAIYGSIDSNGFHGNFNSNPPPPLPLN